MFKEHKDQWDALLYDKNHSFVSQYGQDLLELLAPQKGEHILDLGCGTGDLAKRLADKGVDVTGVDKSFNMVAQATAKYPSISFMVKDATDLGFQEQFHAVFSNATLHWITQPEKSLSEIYNSLKVGGRFVAEFGGKGNVQSIVNELIKQRTLAGYAYDYSLFPWFYPSIAEYTTLMEKVGFRVTLAQHFDRPTSLDGEEGLTNWIHMFGGQLLEGIPKEDQHSIIERVHYELEAILKKDEIWVADYKRIRVIGRKEISY
ncbi:class I SAM-dependent methyltransferase [Bacillus sp. B1-b2]|uniref:class I SAM-dependent methyltransferase n=1 Tax=Bacillus sp. B1-b2 TaxID=2653201 RepID=UPI001262315E|nr:class I SAM-dependent methyltransferase [Bacillus sp. B1-b2]KAB7668885.1 methyltransferase domain-containing protein [Bacillus sp. B1-b2]